MRSRISSPLASTGPSSVSLASLGQQDVKTRPFNSGVDVRTMGPEEFAKYTETEIQKWAKVVKISGAKVE